MLNIKNYQNLSDEEVVELVLDNHSNFFIIIERYQNKLMSYILRLTNVSFEEAEDVLQDVFIKVYKNLNDFDTDLKFSSWIYRIAHNQVISNFRKIKARPQGSMLDVDDDFLNRVISDLDIAREVDIKLIRQNLDRALQQVDKKYKDVLVLRFFEEKDYSEISDILKIPMGTVATLLNRAKKKLKKEFEENDIKF